MSSFFMLSDYSSTTTNQASSNIDVVQSDGETAFLALGL